MMYNAIVGKLKMENKRRGKQRDKNFLPTVLSEENLVITKIAGVHPKPL
jgi:hypothetical protein